MDKEEIANLIKRRRLQILVHSCIYYGYNKNLVSDDVWTKWGLELEKLQNKYPEIASEVIYADDFKDFDHSSGYNLPFVNPEITRKATQLLKFAERMKFNDT